MEAENFYRVYKILTFDLPFVPAEFSVCRF